MANYENPAAPRGTVGSVGLASQSATAAAMSAVSWGAIFAGAAGAAALSFVLVVLGTGLGMSAVSPWAHDGVEASTFGWAAAAWLTFISLAASGVGGYLAGRLRTIWTGLRADEVYFRDTAHGFLAWAVATLIAVVMVSSAVGSALSAGAKAGASVVGGAAETALSVGSAGAAAAAGGMVGQGDIGAMDDPLAYLTDSLFRSSADSTASAEGGSGSPVAARAQEVYRIFARSVRTGEMAEGDSRYVAQLVAQQTGMTQEEAQKRVTEAFTTLQTNIKQAADQAKAAAEKARKATAYASLWMVLSLLVGAFAASICATLGGRQRDHASHP